VANKILATVCESSGAAINADCTDFTNPIMPMFAGLASSFSTDQKKCEIKKSGPIRGYIHCKDCNKKSNLTGDQDVHKQVKKMTEDFEKSIKRIFR